MLAFHTLMLAKLLIGPTRPVLIPLSPKASQLCHARDLLLPFQNLSFAKISIETTRPVLTPLTPWASNLCQGQDFQKLRFARSSMATALYMNPLDYLSQKALPGLRFSCWLGPNSWARELWELACQHLRFASFPTAPTRPRQRLLY